MGEGLLRLLAEATGTGVDPLLGLLEAVTGPAPDIQPLRQRFHAVEQLIPGTSDLFLGRAHGGIVAAPVAAAGVWSIRERIM